MARIGNDQATLAGVGERNLGGDEHIHAGEFIINEAIDPFEKFHRTMCPFGHGSDQGMESGCK